MNKRRMIGIGIVLLLCAGIAVLGFCLDNNSITHIYDTDGTEIARVYVENNSYVYDCLETEDSYIDLVMDELEQIIEQNEHTQDAKSYLTKYGLDVTVYYNEKANQALADAYARGAYEEIPRFASVICDPQGHVLACLSKGDKNYALNPTYAASAIKPLSVYGPALENDTIHWSSLYQDSALMEVSGEDWPKNVEPYTNKEKTVAEGLQKSLNTVAVRILQDYGVKNSMDFIEANFGIDVSEEQTVLQQKGENEVLGNIALGYLRKGVTVKDMAGYYQVFANGGTYQQASAILRVEKNGTSYMENASQPVQVFSSDTAYIMNRMLKLVVEEDGTGKNAYVDGYDICGKTGTSEDNEDHWFVGMTPEYICATWYGEDETPEIQKTGVTASYFAEVVKDLPIDPSVSYPVAEDVVTEEVCKKTGKLASKNCDSFTGYYKKSGPKEACDEN